MSVQNLISRFEKSLTIEISLFISLSLLRFWKSVNSRYASLVRPIQLPLTNTLVIRLSQRSSVVSYSNSCTPQSYNLWMISVELEPTDTSAIKVRFLTSPQALPSGVSAGQIIPQCELCSWRGLVSLPCFESGVVSLRICESDEAKVNRLSTYETPVLRTLFCLSLPQLPVDRADLSPRVICSCLMALISGKTFLLETRSF